MSLLEQFELVPRIKATAKKKTFAERVDGYIDEQRRILNGEVLYNQKGNPKESWYKADRDVVEIKIGIYPLFKEALKCKSEEQYKTILELLSKWEEDKLVKPYMEAIIKKEQKIKEEREKKK